MLGLVCSVELMLTCRELIDQLRIKAFTMAHVDRLGIARVMEEALDHVDPKYELINSTDMDSHGQTD